MYNKSEVITMSNRERIIQMIDNVPDSRLIYIIEILESMNAYANEAAIQEYTPNAETAAAMAEVDNMIKTGTGQYFDGSTEEFMKMMLED